MRATIHDRKGKPITPISTELECSWLLSSEGKCSFTFALTDPKARQLILNAGNLIHIEFENLPFSWGGVIDGDEDWNDDGTITLSAWSGEHLLRFRRTPVDQEFSAPSAGDMLVTLLTIANSPEDLLIREGNIYRGGGASQDTWDGKPVYDHVESVAENAEVEWNIEPAIDENGFLFFKLNAYELRGVTSNLVLKEGHNIRKRSRPLRVRTGDVVNDLLGLGEASTSSRLKYYAPIHTGSRSLYGLRQGTEDFEGVVEPSTLARNTNASLNVKARPKRTHQIEALNIGKTFESLGLGNSYPYQAHTYGWLNDGRIGVDAYIRLTGMRYMSSTDTVEMVGIEEV